MHANTQIHSIACAPFSPNLRTNTHSAALPAFTGRVLLLLLLLLPLLLQLQLLGVRWKCLLLSGWNILVAGCGSKGPLLREFASRHLRYCHVVLP